MYNTFGAWIAGCAEVEGEGLGTTSCCEACAFLCRRTENFARFAILRVILTLGEELGSATKGETASAADSGWSSELPATSNPRGLNLQSLGTMSSPLAYFNRFAFATIS